MNYEEEGVTSTIVTPDLARQWLERNTRNRRVMPNVVNAIATDLENGKWLYTGDPIKFLKDGTLADGQHRLLAIVKTGISCKIEVATGLERPATAYVDGNTGRTLADQATISGRFEHRRGIPNLKPGFDVLRGMFLLKAVKRSNETWFAHMDANYNTIAEVLGCTSPHVKSVTTAPVKGAIARAYNFYNDDESREKLKRFMKVLVTGFPTEGTPDEMVSKLRTKLIYMGVEGASIIRQQKYCMTQAILKAYMEGRNLKKFTPKVTKELFWC